MISVHFQGKPFSITVIQVYVPTRKAKEAEAKWFNEDLQDLLELTSKKDVLFIIGDWNAKGREGNGTPLQYSGLENSMDCVVHGVAESRTQLSDFSLTHSLTLTIKGLCGLECHLPDHRTWQE